MSITSRAGEVTDPCLGEAGAQDVAWPLVAREDGGAPAPSKASPIKEVSDDGL